MSRTESGKAESAIAHGFAVPVAANENLPLLEGCALTPAEVLQWASRERKRLCLAVDADPRLWRCPHHRRTWNTTLGIEQITLRLCFGRIKGA